MTPNRFHLIIPFFISLFLSPPADVAAGQPFSVMTYNAENLFDCRHDTLKNDFEFLPDAPRRWTRQRYWRKLDAITEVIAAAGAENEHIPDLIGLCEVENDSVLFDLTRRSALRTLDYRYLMTNSPDERGIDVALLYQRGSFRPNSCREIQIPVSDSPPTRNILHVEGVILTGDTLHIYVCHLPSRSGDARMKRRLRRLALSVLCSSIDSVSHANPEANIIVMGDFNAETKDKLLRSALPQSLCEPAFSDLGRTNGVRGTYRYQGRWETIDHIFVSRAMMKKDSPLHTAHGKLSVAAFPFLCEPDATHGGVKPFRTYQGPVYKGGYSDHFPLVLELELNN